MSRIRSVSTTLSLAAALTLGSVPAYAGQAEATMTIALDPDAVRPGESTTASGDTAGPACANDGVAVSLSYTKPDGSTGTTSVNTTTDASGHYSASITVPEDAVAGEPATVQALIADCTATEPSQPRSSEAAPLEILAYEGDFTVNKTTGEPGDTVTVAGTNCYGGDVIVIFTGNDDEVPVTLDPDKTFGGTYVLPDVPGGTYSFEAQCPGTDYPVRAFVLVNPDPPAAQPPRPVTGPVRYTG